MTRTYVQRSRGILNYSVTRAQIFLPNKFVIELLGCVGTPAYSINLNFISFKNFHCSQNFNGNSTGGH